jgi:hypothetical protein
MSYSTHAFPSYCPTRAFGTEGHDAGFVRENRALVGQSTFLRICCSCCVGVLSALSQGSINLYDGSTRSLLPDVTALVQKFC